MASSKSRRPARITRPTCAGLRRKTDAVASRALRLLAFPCEPFRCCRSFRRSHSIDENRAASFRVGPPYALDNGRLLHPAALERHRNPDLTPALLLGRNRQREHAAAVQNSDSSIPSTRPHWLWIRASRSKRLEPLFAFPIRLDCRFHWNPLRYLQLFQRTLAQ